MDARNESTYGRNLIIRLVLLVAISVLSYATPGPVFGEESPGFSRTTITPIKTLPYDCMSSLGTRGRTAALPDAGVAATSGTAEVECAETATIEWGDEELTGTLYWSPCVEVDVKLLSCGWCDCKYIAELPGGGYYTFADTSDGGSFACEFDFPIKFH